MIDIFAHYMGSNDQSVVYLSNIFGSMMGVIDNPNGPVNAQNISLLGTMFMTFNSVLLAVAALMVVYTTVVGVMMTAQDGEFMKKWNGLWTPIRTVLGVAALVPTSSGYSGIQVIMMWVIIQGIGAADFVWGTVLGYVTVMGSPYAQSSSIQNPGDSQKMQDLFRVITCDASAKANYPNPSGTSATNGNYYCNINSVSDAGYCNALPTNIDPTQLTVTSQSFGPGNGGACGTITYCSQDTTAPGDCVDSTSLKCLTCKAQVQAFANIIPTFRDLANQFVKADYDYQNYVLNGPTDNSIKIPSWVLAYCQNHSPLIPPASCILPQSAIIVGNSTVSAAVSGYLPSPDPANSSPGNDIVKYVYWPNVIEPVTGSSGFIKTAMDYYTGELDSAKMQYMATLGQNANNLSGPLKDAQITGWIFAGAYYYNVAGVNNAIQDDSTPTWSVVPNDPDTNNNNTKLAGYRNNYAAAGYLIDAMTNNAGLPDAAKPFSGLTSTSANGMAAAFNNLLSGSSSDKVAGLQNFGKILLWIATAFYIAFMAVVLVMAILGNINVWVLGNGFMNPVGPTLTTVSILLLPILFGALGIMVTLGATLSIYVPLIPFVIFTMGAIGWMTSTIEAMVAGPLVALGIMAPSGGSHHEILGKAEPALMLIFAIFLRPTLMIFGMVAAMLLSNVVLTMIYSVFWTVVQSNIQGASAGFGFFIYIGAFVSIVVSALNKCFMAIAIIPEKVMRWISGSGDNYGEESAVHAMKGAVDSGAAGMKGAGDATRSAGGALRAEKKEKDRNAKKKQAAALKGNKDNRP